MEVTRTREMALPDGTVNKAIKVQKERLLDNTGIYNINYHPNKVKDLCLLGLSDGDICRVLDITPSMMDDWCEKYPEFYDSLRTGREMADGAVAAALYKSATGYRESGKVWKTERGMLVEVEEEKVYPPNVTAAMFILKTRHPQVWREGPVTQETIQEDVMKLNDIDLSQFSPEELELMAKMGDRVAEKAEQARTELPKTSSATFSRTIKRKQTA